jgi:integrase
MTTNALVALDSSSLTLPSTLADDVLRAAEHAQHARADNTRRSYARAWEQWSSYAHEHGASALPASPLVIAAYLAHLDNEGLSTSTIDVTLAAIVDRHRAARFPLPTNDPVVRDVRAGIRVRRGTRPKCKAALRPFDLQEMTSALPPDLSGMRDRALLLVGFGSALRRSELSALRVEHVAWHARGVALLVVRSKTDQQGEGIEVPVHAAPGPLCPVDALRAWLDAARITSGPAFRSVSRWGRIGDGLTGKHIAEIVKRAARRIGHDVRDIGAHSLRAGFATTAASVGANLAEIARVTRHESDSMVRRYIRAGTLFERDPLRGVLVR